MNAPGRYTQVSELLDQHHRWGRRIRERLQQFAAVPEQEYFFELLYCLLTPQSSARHAAAAVEELRKADRWDDDEFLAGILARGSAYIRFHNTKARRIVEARERFPAIRRQLGLPHDAELQRQWLVTNVSGMGWKEASHFLRNIGRRNLAILDRHILKNLARHRVLTAPTGSLTERRYTAIEQEFRRFGSALGIPIDELDLLFWSRETGEILK